MTAGRRLDTADSYESWSPDLSCAESNPLLQLPAGLEVLQCIKHIPGHFVENFQKQGPQPQFQPSREFQRSRRQAEHLVQQDTLTPHSRQFQISDADVRHSLHTVRDLPHSAPSWIGQNDADTLISCEQQAPGGTNVIIDSNCSEEVKGYVKEGWKYVANDLGRAQILADGEGAVYMVKCRMPGEDWTTTVNGVSYGWLSVVDSVGIAIEEFSRSYGPANQEVMGHSRGDFPCFSFGNSVGGGQMLPRAKTFNAGVTEALKQFCENQFVLVYVKHIAECFRIWFPKMAQLYSLAQLQLLLVDGLLSQHFPDLQFAACSLNFGLSTVCDWHVDLKNLAFGVCAVGVFGKFNHRTSAQLLLKQPKVAVELRHGDVVFFPSGGVVHKNAELKEGETRSSLVFYSAGGLFRWISQGHHTQVEKRADGDRRWTEGCRLFSSMEELRASCF